MKAYEKLNYLPVNDVAIKAYLDAYYHKDIISLLKECPIEELNKTVNNLIEKEVRNCVGDDFYMEA